MLLKKVILIVDSRKSSSVKYRRSQSADSETHRTLALAQLLYTAQYDDIEVPTLKKYRYVDKVEIVNFPVQVFCCNKLNSKNFRPITERLPKNMFLTAPPEQYKKLNVSEKPVEQEKYIHEMYTADNTGQKLLKTEILHIQYGSRMPSIISSDYVHTLDMIGRSQLASLRSLEYKKSRPMLTIDQYQEKNRKYKEEMERNKRVAKAVSLDWLKETTRWVQFVMLNNK